MAGQFVDFAYLHVMKYSTQTKKQCLKHSTEKILVGFAEPTPQQKNIIKNLFKNKSLIKNALSCNGPSIC